MYSTWSNVCCRTVSSHAPKVAMRRPDEPQAASSMEGSIHFIILAASWAMRPYSTAVLASICHGPSISLPRPQNFTACGLSQPCLRRSSDSVVPPGWLQYSTMLRAASPARVPRLTASIGSLLGGPPHVDEFVG